MSPVSISLQIPCPSYVNPPDVYPTLGSLLGMGMFGLCVTLPLISASILAALSGPKQTIYFEMNYTI